MVSGLENAQEKLVIKRLEDEGARPFLAALGTEFLNDQQLNSAIRSAEEIVGELGRCPADDVQNIFWAVRRALGQARESVHDNPCIRKIDAAAAALYLLAACRLVDRAVAEQSVSGGDAYVRQVSSSESLVCAVIATALFGGELHLKPAENSDLPDAEYFYVVDSSDWRDQIESDFERAVYSQLFPYDRELPRMMQEDRSLDEAQRARLKSRLRDLRNVKRSSFALVVRGFMCAEPFKSFAARHQAPVFLRSTEATEALLGMSADDLVAEIGELWVMVETLRSAASGPPNQPRQHKAQGDPSMSAPPPTGNFTFNGPINGPVTVQQQGSHSLAQAGGESTGHVEHHEGTTDPAALVSALQVLRQAIGEVPASLTTEKLTEHVDKAQAEVGKKEKADPKVLKEAFDKVHTVAETMAEGGKILGHCKTAYNLAATLFGFPPLP